MSLVIGVSVGTAPFAKAEDGVTPSSSVLGFAPLHAAALSPSQADCDNRMGLCWKPPNMEARLEHAYPVRSPVVDG